MSMTGPDFIKEIMPHIGVVDRHEVLDHAANGAVLLDVREPHEFAGGHLPGAVNVSRGVLEFLAPAQPALSNKDAKIVVYCRTGGRAALATHTLRRMGYANAVSMVGGIEDWVKESRPTQKPANAC
jgi:rhodanese-related sulfurtransferase